MSISSKHSWKMNKETELFFRKWSAKTMRILEREMRRLDVKDTDELRRGMSEAVSIEGSRLVAQLKFKLYGRFVDMGAGRPRIEGQNQKRDFLISRGRKPKKWFSAPFYGRLSDLRGGIGYKMTETAIEIIRKTFK